MKYGKVLLVIVGAVIITALGIDAADTMTGSESTLLSRVIETTGRACPEGMSSVMNIPSVSCVDTYEVTTEEECPIANPQSILDSNSNIEAKECIPLSRAEESPWRFITRDQAMQACARVGKRLPTSAEWYQLSLGMSAPEDSCNITSNSLARTGAFEDCVAPNGAHDLVGNVWEWVSDDVIDGKYNGRQLPQTGYVVQVDAAGMATISTSTRQEVYGNDYFWTQQDGAYGIIRGGFYNSRSDAGLYAVHADTPPNTAGTAIGFRCVQ